MNNQCLSTNVQRIIMHAMQGRFHHWGCWGCIPLHQQCLLIWSNNINGPPRATAKYVVHPTILRMALIMLVKCKIKTNK